MRMTNDSLAVTLARRAALFVVALGCAFVLFASFVEHPASPALLGAAAASVPGALVALAARRATRDGLIAGATIFSLVGGSLVTAWLATAGLVAAPSAGPFPLSLVVVLFGVWLIPLAVTGLLFARQFGRLGDAGTR